MSLKEMIKKASPKTTDVVLDRYIPFLLYLMPIYHIDTMLRQRHFLAQLLHESDGFLAVRENLNYSADSLLKTFPKYFSSKEEAEKYAKKPEQIANKVYANRLGNGKEASGDGWRYIGRGLIQISGKDNYSKLSRALFGDERLLSIPEILETPYYAVESACYFWQMNDLNKFADDDDIVAVTKRINGGVTGLDSRKKYYSMINDQ